MNTNARIAQLALEADHLYQAGDYQAAAATYRDAIALAKPPGAVLPLELAALP